RGHRVNTETECRSTGCAYRRVGYSPSNRALRESVGKKRPEVAMGSHHTLKLLAVSILLDRSVLLSSKPLKRSPPFCGPRLDAPSSASALWPTNSDRNLPTDLW